MNKIIRISIPFMIAFLFISLLIWLAGASSQVTAAHSLSTTEGAILVTTLEDELNTDGDCSLREAISATNNNTAVDACGTGDVITDTIAFDVEGIITVNRPLSVTVGGPLVIYGGETVSISGGNKVRIFHVDLNGILTLEGLTITNGSYTFGGGIDNAGSLIIDNCFILSNSSTGYYNGFGGGIFNTGDLSINNSTFHENQTWGYWGLGGAIHNDGTMEINNSSLTNNISWYDRGGGIYNDGTLLISNSNLYNNNAYHDGGAIANHGALIIYDSNISDSAVNYSGGGIFNQTGTVTLTNSTLDNCHALNGGAIYNNSGTMILKNTSLSNNQASYDGGSIFNDGLSVITLSNSIVANSLSGEECTGTIIDGGHNISSDETCGFSLANDSMPNTDPLLGPSQDNGGPTWTHALPWNSPAIDAGDNTQCPSTDQRGMPRPIDGNMDGNPVCDIGSYELIPVSPTLVTISGANQGFVMHAYTFTAVVDPISTTQPLTYTWQASNQASITHTDGLTDTLGFTWEVTGTQSITVTASNPFGSISATHSIIITTPYEIHLPLVKKSSAPPLGSFPTYSLSGGGVFMGLVIIGMVGRWKRRRLL
jgi:CSLREA domain-containing protein